MKVLVLAAAAALVASSSYAVAASAPVPRPTPIVLPPQPDSSKVGSRGLNPQPPTPKFEGGKLILKPGLGLVLVPPSRGL